MRDSTLNELSIDNVMKHTEYLSDNAFYQNPAVLKKLPYDTLKDFSGVTMLAQGPVVLVLNPKVPARDLKT